MATTHDRFALSEADPHEGRTCLKYDLTDFAVAEKGYRLRYVDVSGAPIRVEPGRFRLIYYYKAEKGKKPFRFGFAVSGDDGRIFQYALMGLAPEGTGGWEKASFEFALPNKVLEEEVGTRLKPYMRLDLGGRVDVDSIELVRLPDDR